MLAVDGVVADLLGIGYLHFALNIETHESQSLQNLHYISWERATPYIGMTSKGTDL